MKISKFKNQFAEGFSFSKSVLKEVHHLKFPTKSETASYLVVVLLMAMFCATLFFIIDMFSYKIVNKIIAIFL